MAPALHRCSDVPAERLRVDKLMVAIVSRNPETLDGLQAYLRAAGVPTWSTAEIHSCTELASRDTVAFILFPDDFRTASVVGAVAELGARRPSALRVLVTSHARELEGLGLGDGVLVVPRPVWGWAILDAIRAHLDRTRKPGGARGGPS